MKLWAKSVRLLTGRAGRSAARGLVCPVPAGGPGGGGSQAPRLRPGQQRRPVRRLASRRRLVLRIPLGQQRGQARRVIGEPVQGRYRIGKILGVEADVGLHQVVQRVNDYQVNKGLR